MWRQIFCHRISCFWSGTFYLEWLRQLFAFGAFQRGTCWHLLILLNASIISLWKLHCLWGPGGECLQPSLEISGKLRVSSSSSGPSCSVQVSSRTCQWSTQTFTSGGSMLDGGSLASHSSQHAGRCSSAVSRRKRSRHGCLGRPGTQGSVVSAFNPLAAQQCVLHQQGFSSLVCQAVAGATQMSTSRVYQQCWREWAGWCARQGLPNNAISAPKLANFCYICFRWDWPGIPLVSIILLFLHFRNLIAFTRHLIILLFLN